MHDFPVRLTAPLQSGACTCNLASLHCHYFSVALTCALVVGCSAPVCRRELVEQQGRCVTQEAVAQQCEPACSPTAHQVCDGDAEAPSCVCAPGYSGVPCTWTGVLNDPGFENQDAWTRTEGAEVLQNREDTPIDEGYARIERSAACDAGIVGQTVQMPSYEVAEPLVAEVTYRAEGLFGLALGFNRAWALLPLTTDFAWTSEPGRVCLGETAYGKAVTVQVSTPDKHPSCFGEQEGEINVDRLEIVPAEPGECPAPGEALNAAGEEEGGWEFDTTDTTGTAEAGIVEGAGRGGTSGIRISREGTARAAASTKLSVPSSESLKSPALRFWWKGTSGSPFLFQLGRFNGVRLDAFPLDTVKGNGSDRNFVYCLPPWTHGNVVDLIFGFATGSSTELTELVIDDIEIISDDSCGTSTELLDPGFEAGPNGIMGVTIFPPFEAAAVLRNEPSLARTGDGVLELSYSNESAVMWFETWMLAPESNGVDGPAVAFWSKVPADDEAVEELSIQSVKGRAAVEPADLQLGGGWVRNEVCIFPEWSGRWFRLQLQLGDFSPRPDRPVEPPIRIYIDDLELTTSSACPAE